MSDDVLVLWDIDGTLLNSGGVGRDLYEEVFLQLFGRSLAACAPMAGRTDRAIILETLTLAGVDEPRRYVDPFIAGLGARAQAVHESVAARGQALPGAAEVLAALAVARSLGSFAAFGSAFPGADDKAAVMDKAVPMDKSGAVDKAGAVGAGPVGGGAAGTGAVSAGAAQLAAAQAAVALAGAAHTAVTPAAAAQMAAAQVAVAQVTGPVTGSVTAAAGSAVAVQTTAVPSTTAVQSTSAVQSTAAAQAAVAVQLIPSQAPAAQPATSHMTVVPRAGAGPASGAAGLPAGGARSSRRVYQSVLTGNIRPLAEVKLAALSLRDGIDLCIGAYGDDHEDRTELVHVARRRAAGVVGRSPSSFSGTSTVVIGDTPLDVSAALSAGARAVGVATGSYSAADLLEAGAHAVLPDLTDTSAVLRALLG